MTLFNYSENGTYLESGTNGGKKKKKYQKIYKNQKEKWKTKVKFLKFSLHLLLLKKLYLKKYIWIIFLLVRYLCFRLLLKSLYPDNLKNNAHQQTRHRATPLGTGSTTRKGVPPHPRASTSNPQLILRQYKESAFGYHFLKKFPDS